MDVALEKRQVQRAYEFYAPVYDFVFDWIFAPGRSAAIKHCALAPGETVLEVGIGTGLNLPLYPPACRLTGMTRFASFWVEGGRIVAPVDVMRFDDSVFRLLGQELVGLTSERELLVNSDSYHQRNANSMRLPGAVVREMAFTL